MGQVNPFIDVLNRTQPPADERQPALDLLDQFCAAIQQKWAGRIECRRVTGYPTNYGQEYRVVIRSMRTGYEHTLLRAYIPANARGMKLDLYDYTMLDCPDVPALEAALAMFLAKPETQDAIQAYGGR